MPKPKKIEDTMVYNLVSDKWKNKELIKRMLWIAYLEGYHDANNNNGQNGKSSEDSI